MFIADLHIHSHYSRATSKDCTPEYLELWARRKGIDIVGTGDFTHPAWRRELEEKLEPAEEGLYTLKEEYRIQDAITDFGRKPRFVVSGEISSIYKKGEKVHKVHSLLLLPSLEDADVLAKKLESIGNIHSDGRPILGLDCRDLLAIMLELCPSGMYVPAHIWTPHFSLFGAFSGFNSVEECFGDLTPYIHAMETGLSSDPPMNWRLSFLDSFQLVSNSDAHSPAKLGREANLLDISLSYEGLFSAIQEGKGLAGTIEFFPEEGKYHYDGHRKCHVCLSPSETERYQGKCPICGKKLTIGVSHRIEQLADRTEGYQKKKAKPFESLVPLPEVIAAFTGHAAAGSKVQKQYEEMLGKLGSEFSILRELPFEDIKHAFGYAAAEGIRRLRAGQVKRQPGYDGEYGIIQLFELSELEELNGQLSFFSMLVPEKKEDRQEEKEEAALLSRKFEQVESCEKEKQESLSMEAEVDGELWNPEQYDAIRAIGRAIAVIAGPGTGKTKTLVSRMIHLIQERGVKPSQITAVTFTNKAAEEMYRRLEKQMGGKRAVHSLRIGTFHSICYEILKEQRENLRIADEMETVEFAKQTIEKFNLKLKPQQFLKKLSMKKMGAFREKENRYLEAFEDYQRQMECAGVLDFDDLLIEGMKCFQDGYEQVSSFSYLLVDEFQDVSPMEYEIIREWSANGKELFVIGDPDQSIYGFRGSDNRCFEVLSKDYPDLEVFHLSHNYRSVPPVLFGAMGVIAKNPPVRLESGQILSRTLVPCKDGGGMIRVVSARSERSEAIFAAKEINRLIGGIDMLDAQAQQENKRNASLKGIGFGDIAILYRTHRQAELLEYCLHREGIPYVVIGKEEFLGDPAVRGTVCFFRSLLEENPLAENISQTLLWGDQEEEKAKEEYRIKRETYLVMVQKKNPYQVLKKWREDMGFSDHSAMEKFSGMAKFYKRMPELIRALIFGKESDLRRCNGKFYESDMVTLMTLHGAKGLEFPVVMIYGAEKGTIPFCVQSQDCDLKEERRLFYVGMTRAKEELILLTSAEDSEFIADIPEEILSREEANGKKSAKDSEGGRQMSLFDFMEST